MSSKFAARLVRDEPAEVISNNPGWLLQVQRHKSSEFVVPFVSCHRKSNPASIQIGNLAGFCKSMQNSAEAAGQREPPIFVRSSEVCFSSWVSKFLLPR
jgi:hypothetical protein